MRKGIMKFMNKSEGADSAELAAELESLKAEMSGVAQAHTALQSEYEQIKASYEEAVKSLKELQEVKAAMESEAAQKRMDARKQKISATIGDSKVESLMAATESLDDVAFDAVVAAMAMSTDVEAKSEMFVEKGVTAEVDASKVETDDKDVLRQMLAEKYSSK